MLYVIEWMDVENVFACSRDKYLLVIHGRYLNANVLNLH